MTWFFKRPQQAQEYSIYTTAFDVEMPGDDLHRKLTPDAWQVWMDQIAAYQQAVDVLKTKAGLESLVHIDDLIARTPAIGATTAVSVLVDHSGSLKGQRAIIACLLVEVISDFLSRLGLRFEILGFTTVEWLGGRSRKRWLARGRPRNPGRLNDLLHICYRKASDTNPGAPWSVYNLLRNDLLKENVDGEAVFWAAERLKDIGADQSVIISISDGVPVDDSTLYENPPGILLNHLKSVVSDVVETPGFKIAAIGIDHDVGNIYPTSVRLDRLAQVSKDIPSFLRDVLS